MEHLCYDYLVLNAKIYQEWHGLLKIKDTLHSLGGNILFSALDQSETYHNYLLHLGDSTNAK